MTVIQRTRTVQLSHVQRDPYRQRLVRKVIDAGAFKIYGHWVKRSMDENEQNRAAIFQNSIKLEMKLLSGKQK